MNSKFDYKLLLIAFLIFISVVVITIFSFKKYTQEQTIFSAKMVSDMVQSTLSSNIKNEENHNIDSLLSSLSHIKNFNNVSLIRSETLLKQFGDNTNKKVSQLDKQALSSGEMKYKIVDDKNATNLEISIPIKAVWTNSNDCSKCHSVNFGDTLAVVSIDMKLSDFSDLNLSSIYLIPLIVLIGIILLLILFYNTLKQYLTIFDSLTKSLNSVVVGKFKKIPYPVNSTKETVTLIDNFNKLFGTFKETSLFIEKKLKGFIGTSNNHGNLSHFEASKEIISNLSNLYQFKKEIELDNTKDEIFDRLSEVFVNQFNLKNFNFIKINSLTNKIKVIKEHGNLFYCKGHILEHPEDCRASRTKNDVVSIDYHYSCPYFKLTDKFHYCLSTSITKDINLIINFLFDSKEELENIKDNITFIKSYINEAAPSIEAKILMEALQESAFRDGLTGLYNRKFLEEHTKKLIPQAKRQNYNIAVLLLDMDHFKAVNDEYGHDIGDKVLKELSRILTETVRESDIVIRYGGEEFMVLLVNIVSVEAAMDVANKIRIKVSENEIDVYAGSKLRKTISIGLSMFPQDSTNLESVIKNADIALYEAKNKGRNQVVRFTNEQISSVELF